MNTASVQLLFGDCLDRMKEIEDGSVDLILCDLPYGTTACLWDSVIDLERLWEQYRRVIKRYRPIVLTAVQPFTTALGASNLPWLRYDWVWEKNRPTNFAHAKNKPMKKHESVLVFSEGSTVHASQSERRMPYHPQGLTPVESPKVCVKRPAEMTDAFFQARPGHGEFTREFTNYPHTILRFATDQLGVHPTAKPVDLMEYLVRTYTEGGETVLDNAMGSGTTGVACLRSGRRFIGIDNHPGYFEVAKARLVNLPVDPEPGDGSAARG